VIILRIIHVYTDGACSGNPGPGGWGFAIIDKNKDEIVVSKSGRDKNTTNNKMELTAALNALTYMHNEFQKRGITDVEILLHTDSAYTMNSMSIWAHSWKKNGWKKKDKKPIENPDLIIPLYKLCHESNLKVTFVKVKAHQTKGSKDYDKFNDYVDKLATGDIS
jgi:ribonuclease HI